jgi:predicted DNA-binding transcriptional regulator YafY
MEDHPKPHHVPKGKSAAELASDLEFHPRTLYRDLEALQVAGTEEIRAESEALLGKYGGDLLSEEKPSVA